MDVYLNDWAKGGRESMLRDFQIEESALEGAEVLLASYTYECYEGSAVVVLRKGGKLYEVRGGHCSCYGLEGQWEPEETSPDALRKGDEYRYAGCLIELGALLERLEHN